jgi:hypothetical protein
MPRPTTLFQYNYETLLKVTGDTVSMNDLYQHRTRNNIDPENFESVLVWCARHARQDLKEKILRNALDPTPVKVDEVAKKASLPSEESSKKPAKKALKSAKKPLK